jgi:hypothetical protein
MIVSSGEVGRAAPQNYGVMSLIFLGVEGGLSDGEI